MKINTDIRRMMTMNHKTIKKLGSILSLALFCFLIVGCSQENSNKGEAVVSTEDKNKVAVRAVLESEFTVPNEEYILVQKNIDKKMTEIRQSLPEGSSFGIPEDSPEWLAYEELVKKTYGPYFMDYMYEHLIPINFAFSYHYGYLWANEDVRYDMKVSDIQVSKSENEKTPKSYNFTAKVEYKNNSDEVTTHEIKGRAILSEVGKIGKFTFLDDGGLREKTREDIGY
jgi:hypothetical protein